MKKFYEISKLMLGSSLCLVGSVFIIDGSLTLLGYAVFAPMAIGGFGLFVEGMQKIFPSLNTLLDFEMHSPVSH